MSQSPMAPKVKVRKYDIYDVPKTILSMRFLICVGIKGSYPRDNTKMSQIISVNVDMYSSRSSQTSCLQSPWCG